LRNGSTHRMAAILACVLWLLLGSQILAGTHVDQEDHEDCAESVCTLCALGDVSPSSRSVTPTIQFTANGIPQPAPACSPLRAHSTQQRIRAPPVLMT